MVRFHAIQATLLGLSLAVLNLTLWIVLASLFRYSWYVGVRFEPFLYYVYMAEAVLWIVMLYFGCTLALLEVPSIGTIAKRLANLR